MNEAKHSKKVVKHFKSLLSEELVSQIDEDHFAQLELMIESAIDASMLETINRAKSISAKATEDISHILEKI